MTPAQLAAYRQHVERATNTGLTPLQARRLFEHIDEQRAEIERLTEQLNSVKTLAVDLQRCAAFQVSQHPHSPQLEYIEYTARKLLAALGVEPAIRLGGGR